MKQHLVRQGSRVGCARQSLRSRKAWGREELKRPDLEVKMGGCLPSRTLA